LGGTSAVKPPTLLTKRKGKKMRNARKLINDMRDRLDALEAILENNEASNKIPNNAMGTFNLLRKGKFSVMSLAKKLKKSEGTIYTEMWSIRKAGYALGKEYNKRKRMHEYRLEK
jgi:hypothetical protein